MAKKQVAEKTSAEIFALQRRLRVVPREQGERLMQELIDLGFKVKTRGDDSLTQVSVEMSRFVIDLTK